MNNEIFDLEYQWQEFLRHYELSEEVMPERQRIEMKRAFFGCAGQLLILLRDDLAALPMEEGSHILQKMLDQTMDFWKQEISGRGHRTGNQ